MFTYSSLRRVLTRCLALLPGFLAVTSHTQAWNRVLNQSDQPATGVGGGSGNTLYAGLANGTVHRSDDNGLTWTSASGGLLDATGRGMAAKAFIVTASGRVIRGGDNASWNNRIGSPIFYSDNRGQTWTEAPLPFLSTARNPGGIGVSGFTVQGNAIYFSDVLSEGVWKSVDNGQTWSSAGAQLPTIPFVGFTKTYYAVAAGGGALLTVESTRGVFRSTDGGGTWNQAVQGMPGVANSPLFGGRTWSGTDVVGTPDGTAYAAVDNQLFRTANGGQSWTPVAAGILLSPNPFAPTIIQPNVRKVETLGDRVYVSSNDGNPRFFEGAAVGTDAESWTELPRIVDNADNANILAESFAAHNGALYFTGKKGLYRLDLATSVRTPIRPVVTVSPSAPLVANVGSSIRATARATGTAPFTYEWRLNGAAIPGQTAAELNWPAVSTNQTGTLSLVVQNLAGAVTNQIGAVSVAPIAPGAPDYSFRPQVTGTAVGAFAQDRDGSIYFTAAYPQLVGTYNGVRRASLTGVVDERFNSAAVTGTPNTILPLGDGSALVGSAGDGDNNRYYRRLLPDGSIDASWPWPVEAAGGMKKIVRLPDGRFLAAGGSVGGIHRFNADGTLDPSFQRLSTIGTFQRAFINDFAVLADGSIVVAGNFSTLETTFQIALARLLPNGGLDRNWKPAAIPNGSAVNVILPLPDGRFLIGGNFQTVGGQTRRGLARLNADGSLDAAFPNLLPNTSTVGVVNALAPQPDGKVWVGGSFTGVSDRNHLLRLNTDGTVDTSFPDVRLSASLDQTAPAPVLALKFGEDGRLWIGSSAIVANGFSVGQLFRIFTDVNRPPSVFAGLDQTPDVGSQVALQGSVGGAYTSLQWRFNGQPIPGATGLTLTLDKVSSAANGAYDLVATTAVGVSTSAPISLRARGPVTIDLQPSAAVAVVSNSVSFSVTAFGKLPLAYQWSKDGALLSNQTNRSLTLTNVPLAAAGDYSVRVSGGDGSAVASEPAFLTIIPAPGSTNAAFKLGLSKSREVTLFKDIEFLPDGRALVVGNFSIATNTTDNAFIARLNTDGSIDRTFRFNNAGLTSVTAIERLGDGRIFVLGTASFQTVLRRFNEDGNRDAAFPDVFLNSGLDVKSAADGSALVLAQSGVERVLPNGTVDTAFGQRTRTDSSLQSISVDPAGRIYITGYFNNVGGQRQPQFARLLADGSLDAGFRPTNVFSSQWTVTALSDGALVGDLNGFGKFGNDGSVDRNYSFNTRLQVWDVASSGLLGGVLPTTSGDGVLRQASGAPALPVATMKVPFSFTSYSLFKIAPDGAFWVALGGDGNASDPALKLFRLNGTVTPLALLGSLTPQTVNAGATVTWTISATGTSRVDYQWQFNDQDIAGATNASLTLPSVGATATGVYSVRVRNRSGSLTSNAAALVVLAAPEILSSSPSQEVAAGNALILTVNARGVAPLAYQWRRNGVAIPSANTANYTNRLVGLTDSGIYEVVVSNSLGSKTSPPASIQVVSKPGSVLGNFPDLNLGLGAKELNVLPSGDLLVDGSAYTRFGSNLFSLQVTTTDLRERIAVDPMLGRIYMVDGPRFAFDLKGVQLTAIPRPAANWRLVRLEESGNLLVTDYSFSPILRRLNTNGVVLTNFTSAVTPVIDAAPLPDGRILVLSYTQRAALGTFVFDTTVSRLLPSGALDPSFARLTNSLVLGKQADRVIADRKGRALVFGSFDVWNGQPRSRIVRLLDNGAIDPDFVPANINNTVSEMAEQLNGKWVVVGAFTQVDSAPRNLVARLNADGSHDVAFNPGTGLTVSGGQSVAFDVKLLPAGEIAIAGTFQSADGVSHKGVVMLAGDTADLYFVREPRSAELAPGTSAELSAEGAGTSAVTYQWFKDGQPLAGETNPILRLVNVGVGVAGSYHVVIRNGSGELPSGRSVVSVITPPSILVQPSSVVRSPGETTLFSVEVAGLQLNYQWQHAGTNIPGATNPVLTLTNLTASDGGVYSVRITNPAGSVLSRDTLLRLRPTIGGATNGLVGELKFDGNVRDTAEKMNNVFIGAPAYVPGVDGNQAIKLRSGMNWVLLFKNGNPLIKDAYSVSFWIKPEAPPQNLPAGEPGASVPSANVYSFLVAANNLMREHLLMLGGTDGVTGTATAVLGTRGLTSVICTDPRASLTNLFDKWTHIAVSYNGAGLTKASNFAFFINGERLSLSESPIGIGGNTANPDGLGRYSPFATFALDNFKLFNIQLPEPDLVQLFKPGSSASVPSISSQPSGGAVAAGSTFSFNVKATGADLFYEWYRDNVLLPEADGPSLTLRAASTADAGAYKVVISNGAGRIESTSASLNVQASADPFDAWATAAGLTGTRAALNADPDGDGILNLAEFVYGTSPTAVDRKPTFEVGTVTVAGAAYPAVTFTRRTQIGTARLSISVASSVTFDDATPAEIVSNKALADGLEQLVVRGIKAIASNTPQFFRFTVQK